MFIKVCYWLIVDRLYVPSYNDKSHKFKSNFVFEDKGVRVDPETGHLNTTFDDSNILMIPLGSENFDVNVSSASEFPISGWVSNTYNHIRGTSQVDYNWESNFPGSMDLLIFPYRNEKLPELSVTKKANHGTNTTSLIVSSRDWVDEITLDNSTIHEKKPEQKPVLTYRRAFKSDKETQKFYILENGEFLTDEIPAPESHCDNLNFHYKREKNSLKIYWKSPKNIDIWAVYGYSLGGGVLFKTDRRHKFNKRGVLKLYNLKPNFLYDIQLFALDQKFQPINFCKKNLLSI